MKKLIILSIALSGLCLTACGANAHKNTTESSSKPVKSSQDKKSKSQETPSSEQASNTDDSKQNEIVPESSSQSNGTVQQGDLDIDAINNDDIQSLVGTWKNGNGDTITINADKSMTSTSKNSTTSQTITTIKNNTAKIPSVSASNGTTGFSLELFKIGFSNPFGDQSDTSRARLVATQNPTNYSPDTYYYKQ